LKEHLLSFNCPEADLKEPQSIIYSLPDHFQQRLGQKQLKQV